MSTAVVPTPATPDVCSVTILADGEEVPGTLQVLSVSITNELNRIPRATLQIQDGDAATTTFAVSDTERFVPGTKLEIRLGYRSIVEPVFVGVVVKHAIRVRERGTALLVECRDDAVRMTTGLQSRYHADTKDSDILEALIDQHQLTADVAATTPTLKEVVQYESTDWDFLVCRAEANGHVVVVRDGKVTVGPPVADGDPVVSVGFGATVLELDAEVDARWQSSGLTAMSWDPADQAVIEAEATEPTPLASGNLSATDLADVLGGDAHRVRHAGRLSQPELQAWADGRLAAHRLAKVRGRARFQGFAGVHPGTLIEVTGIGARFEGKQYVSGIRHTVVNGNWETDVSFGLRPDRFATTYPVTAPAAAGLVPAVSGLQVATVTALEDPDGEERVKVRIPLVSTSEEGTWARLATLDAGAERGTFLRPEIGDEVVVGFLAADPRFPVVLGSCHSSANAAPEPADDDNHHKGYQSRSKLRLTFDDDKKVVVIETPAGNRITLSEDDKKLEIVDQNQGSIVMDDRGITIESAKDLTLKAGKDITIEGATVKVTAKNGLKADGGATAELTGSSTKVNGDASTVIKGGTVQIN